MIDNNRDGIDDRLQGGAPPAMNPAMAQPGMAQASVLDMLFSLLTHLHRAAYFTFFHCVICYMYLPLHTALSESSLTISLM